MKLFAPLQNASAGRRPARILLRSSRTVFAPPRREVAFHPRFTPLSPGGRLARPMPFDGDVTIAIPIWQQRISPLLDTAARLLVLTCKDGQEASRREIILEPQRIEALAETLANLHLDLLLCGALSGSLQRRLHEHGVRVRPHLCGEVEAVLQAFCHQELERAEFQMPGCRKPAGDGKYCRRKSRRFLKTDFKPNSLPHSS